ncbi:MAG: molecular chaperone DnaJ [Sphaerobacter sp.]|nr:molecular chaperone DnaJ [Sphaerobacter sp.]
MLPARVDELERVRLEVELLRQTRAVEQLRQLLVEEEAAQEALRRRIEARLGPLRRDVERLKAEVERLDQRLQRLLYARQSLSDEELDEKEDTARAEEAAWWAEWRRRRAEREQSRRGHVLHQNGHDDITLRRIYRTLARLVHPDLARDPADRSRREAVMRLANAARDAGDVDQLRRLLAIWARPDEGDRPRDVEVLRARIGQRRVEAAELRRQLNQLRHDTLGRLLRRGEVDIHRYLRNEEARLTRELAMLRLRRRRALRQLEERRRDLGVSAGE